MQNNRSSNIELLKIVAMIFITLSHCLPVYGKENYLGWIDEQNAVLEINSLLVLFLRHVGQIGNILFVISSAWFLVDNGRVKPNKIIAILLNAFFISAGGLIIGLFCGIKFPASSILKMLFPTTSGLNWFVGCYLLLYAVHGYLNIMIDNSSKKSLMSLVLVLMVLYLVVCMALPDVLYYSRLICFITVYLMVGYMKRYMLNFSGKQKVNIKLLILLALIYIGSIFIYLSIATTVGFLQGCAIKLACTNNVIMILMDVALFNVFKELKFPYSAFINKVASVSLVFYLITENRVLAGHLRPAFFQWIYTNYGYGLLPVWIFLLNLVTFSVGIFVSLLYSSTIGRLSTSISKQIEKFLQPLISKLCIVLMRID